MTELKPCPFCGVFESKENKNFSLHKEDCYLRLVESNLFAALCKRPIPHSDEVILEAWNTRVERTCHIVGVRGGGLCESVAYYLSCGHVADMAKGGRFEYCPNCGAKVVSEQATLTP